MHTEQTIDRLSDLPRQTDLLDAESVGASDLVASNWTLLACVRHSSEPVANGTVIIYGDTN